MTQSEDIDFISKEAARTKLRQSYFAKAVKGKDGVHFYYGEDAKMIRDAERTGTVKGMVNNAKTG